MGKSQCSAGVPPAVQWASRPKRQVNYDVEAKS